MAKPKDITELRDQLLEAYEAVKGDAGIIEQVREMNNSAGKIIGTVKIELEYAALRGECPSIKFMGEGQNVRKLAWVPRTVPPVLKSANEMTG